MKTSLYIQARFKDVETEWLKIPEHLAKIHQGWVVTNTKFTTDAIQYGTCAGLKLVGWNYPDGNSLRSQIDALKLYLITCLTSLTKFEKQKLLENKIVLCRELRDDKNLLIKIGVKAKNRCSYEGSLSALSTLEKHYNYYVLKSFLYLKYLIVSRTKRIEKAPTMDGIKCL